MLLSFCVLLQFNLITISVAILSIPMCVIYHSYEADNSLAASVVGPYLWLGSFAGVDGRDRDV